MTKTKRQNSQLRHLADRSASVGRMIRVEVGRGRSAQIEYLWVEPTACGQEVTYPLVHAADVLSDVLRYAGPEALCPACLSHYFGGR